VFVRLRFVGAIEKIEHFGFVLPKPVMRSL